MDHQAGNQPWDVQSDAFAITVALYGKQSVYTLYLIQ